MSTPYIRNRRNEQTIREHCQSLGFDGNPLTKRSQLGTLREELTAIGVYLGLPTETRRQSATSAMVRSAVLSSSRQQGGQRR